MRDVQLRWQYEADEISSLASPVIAKVTALEMVFIPSGGFFAGAVNSQVVNGQFEDGDSGQPFVVKSEGELTNVLERIVTLGNEAGRRCHRG